MRRHKIAKTGAWGAGGRAKNRVGNERKAIKAESEFYSVFEDDVATYPQAEEASDHVIREFC